VAATSSDTGYTSAAALFTDLWQIHQPALAGTPSIVIADWQSCRTHCSPRNSAKFTVLKEDGMEMLPQSTAHHTTIICCSSQAGWLLIIGNWTNLLQQQLAAISRRKAPPAQGGLVFGPNIIQLAAQTVNLLQSQAEAVQGAEAVSAGICGSDDPQQPAQDLVQLYLLHL
jgi:hypothetical protein